VIQLVSNASRAVVQREHARFDWLVWYALPLIPAGLLGLALARALPEQLIGGAIGAVVLVATWLPRRRLAPAPGAVQRPRARFLALGSVTGFLNMVIGAVGPLIDPFFLGLGLSRQALVGTKAGCQMVGHGVKVVLFGVTGFAFAEHAPLLALGSLCAIAGTWLGSRLLDQLSERSFLWLYRGVLSGLALRLVWKALPI
jgi:uncharacterized membrane protein YfcA